MPQGLMERARMLTPPHGDMLTPLLADRHPGARIVILGNGPSACGYEWQTGDIVIACNNALALCPSDRIGAADYWLVTEGGAHQFPWFWQHADYAGQVVWDCFNCHAAARLYAEYGEPFLSRVCWVVRSQIASGFNLREYGNGLAQSEVECAWRLRHLDTPSGEYNRLVPVGTVVMQALHLAGIMGAASVDIWGAEFYFPGGRQHADEYAPFTRTHSEVGVIDFDMLDGEAVPVMHGAYQTTRQFFYSAAAIRDLIDRIGDEMRITDHSGGLLTPERLPRLRADRAEPGMPAATGMLAEV